MALKKLKRGDLVAVKVPGYGVTYKCVVTSARDGVTGRMIYMKGDEKIDLYYEKKDLANMRVILTHSQYQKYLQLLNVTFHNRGLK